MSTPAAGPDPVVTGDAAFQNEVLEELAGAVNYRGWLVSLVEPQLGEDPLEVGSGTGEYAASLSAQGQRVTVSEAYGPSLRRLQERFAGDERVTVRGLVVPADVEGDYSSVFAFNVLEHIPDDAAAVASMGRLVRPGGRVMIFVPAFMLLMSGLTARWVTSADTGRRSFAGWPKAQVCRWSACTTSTRRAFWPGSWGCGCWGADPRTGRLFGSGTVWLYLPPVGWSRGTGHRSGRACSWSPAEPDAPTGPPAER